ncbi:MAG: S1 RNA-binding domain-containing protein [Candidatus Liptonbacteria bacterium]|nr:S1 RNA-binding domain-containing protein [Candidatus Liptonbacteria bacterium]
MTNNDKTTTLAEMIKSEAGSLKFPREGELTEAVLIEKAPREAYFDLGAFGTGMVFGLEYLNAKDVLKNLKVGDKVSAKIIALDGEGGYVELSLGAAEQEKVWDTVRELAKSGEVIAVKISGANSGGLMALINELKAFLPVSQLSNEHYPRISAEANQNQKEGILKELKKFVGEELKVKVIDANPRTQKLIISEREITDANVKELLKKYEVGQVVTGMVSGVADFGAFVKFIDDPEVEGLIHISELAHRLIDNPKEVVKVDEVYKVKIIDIKEGRVFLSLKALQPDPWATVAERFKEGEEVKGTVKKFNPYGAFIDLTGDIQGLIHVSEFGGTDEMKAAIELGKEYGFIISSLKPEEKRILLKMKK